MVDAGACISQNTSRTGSFAPLDVLCDCSSYAISKPLALLNQLSLRETVMARTNRASCLHRLGRIQEAVSSQERAIRLHLRTCAVDREHSLPSLVGVVCGDLQQTSTSQLMLMTQGIFRLCLPR